MNIKNLLGMQVLDTNVRNVGKIKDVDFNIETGKIEKITLSLQKNLFSTDEMKIDYDAVKNIGDYVMAEIDAEKARATLIE